MLLDFLKGRHGDTPALTRSKPGNRAVGLLIAGAVLLLLTALFLLNQYGHAAHPSLIAVLVFFAGVIFICVLARLWLRRIDTQPLLRSDEKLQNKDSLVIATTFLLAMHLGLCVTAASAVTLFPNRGCQSAFLAVCAALAAASVGGTFGFLLGHPRRTTDDATGKDGRTGSSWLLRTGLDDIVDWLVKGLTTVLLVDANKILHHLKPLAQVVGRGIAGTEISSTLPDEGYVFALSLIVYFTLFGVGATCLVTRTYLTGALGRADRSTVNAFSRVGLDWGEILTLVGAQRSLGSRAGDLTSEVRSVAEKLAALSLVDLHTPQEFALWAKSKSALGQSDEALRGYEKAILQCDCDPALLLDYAVALNTTDNKKEVVTRLKQALGQISASTPALVVKNIYKSLTFALLYQPQRADFVLKLIDEYFARKDKMPSGGLRVNQACALGQRVRTAAASYGLLYQREDGILCVQPAERGNWPEPVSKDYAAALTAIREALEDDSEWTARLAELLTHGAPGKPPEDNDLEVFETFSDFRLLLGLPLLPDAPSKPYVDPKSPPADPGKGNDAKPPGGAPPPAGGPAPAGVPAAPGGQPPADEKKTDAGTGAPAAIDPLAAGKPLPVEVTEVPSQSVPAVHDASGTAPADPPPETTSK